MPRTPTKTDSPGLATKNTVAVDAEGSLVCREPQKAKGYGRAEAADRGVFERSRRALTESISSTLP